MIRDFHPRTRNQMFFRSGSRIRIRNTGTEYDSVLCSDWLTVVGPTTPWVPVIEYSR
jgi:hypothetical protein